MGINVVPQGFQRMVSDCTKHLKPGTMPYIDDQLSPAYELFVNLMSASCGIR